MTDYEPFDMWMICFLQLSVIMVYLIYNIEEYRLSYLQRPVNVTTTILNEKVTPPEKNYKVMMDAVHSTGSFVKYSMFPITDWVSWRFYRYQEARYWPDSDVHVEKDVPFFFALKSRPRELVLDLLSFFAPSDGLVNQSLIRQLQEATSMAEVCAIIIQSANESVHGVVYSRFAEAFCSNDEERQRVFSNIDNQKHLRRKAELLDKYPNSDESREVRDFAQACGEGISFAGLFAVVFIFDGEGRTLAEFLKANIQISTDELGHRDFFAARARGKITQARAEAIVQEFVNEEIECVKHLLREPVFSVDEDRVMNLSIESVSGYIKNLADQVLVKAGLQILYRVTPNCPWLARLSLEVKTNFYEDDVVSYSRTEINPNEINQSTTGKDTTSLRSLTDMSEFDMSEFDAENDNYVF